MNYVRRGNVVAKSIAFDSSQRPIPKWTIPYRVIAPLAMVCDAVVIYLVGVLAAVGYHWIDLGTVVDFTKYLGLSAMVVALFVLVGQNNNRYEPAELLNFKAQLRQVTLDWFGVFLFLIAVGFSMKIGESFSRGAVFSFAGAGFIALVIERIAWRFLLADGLAIRKFSSRKVALIADQDSAIGITEALTRHGMQPTFQFLLPRHKDNVREWDDTIGEAIASIRGSDVEEIIIGSAFEHWSELGGLSSRLRILPLPVTLIPIGAASELLKLPLHSVGDTVTIELQRGSSTYIERAIKRTLDMLTASALLVMTSPLLLLAAIAIKLESKGPVIFQQRRCGFNGRQFNIFKLRTMFVEEDGDNVVAAKPKDSRTTRVGQVLRRTSLDELPQLINVLRGEMSIIGPRPHAVIHDVQFDKLVGIYAYRQHVKPGITGWAQVHGCRGSMKTVADIEKRVKLDLWYINNWSFAVDFKILLMTVIEIFRGKNAY